MEGEAAQRPGLPHKIRVTASQDVKAVGDLWRSSGPQQGHPEWVAQDHIQPAFEDLQEISNIPIAPLSANSGWRLAPAQPCDTKQHPSPLTSRQ